MAFRRSANRHDIWLEWCARYGELLRSLPAFAKSSERAFRTLVTQGEVTLEQTGESFSLSACAPADLADIWDFVNRKTQFDMDAATFDALNEQVRRRVPPGFSR